MNEAKQKIEEAKKALEEALLPLVRKFEQDTGLQVSEIAIDRVFFHPLGERKGSFQGADSINVRLHSL